MPLQMEMYLKNSQIHIFSVFFTFSIMTSAIVDDVT